MAFYPSISFIVISYQRPHYLQLCLESIKRQLYQDYEIIVSDDGSDTDAWRIVAESYGAKTVTRKHDYIDDKPIRNTPAVVNQGVALAEKEIIQILQQDHVLAPDFGLWLAMTHHPMMVMHGLTDQYDGVFTINDLDAMVRTVHIPLGEVRFDRHLAQGRDLLREYFDWREADGMDWAVAKMSWEDLDTRFIGQDHSIPDWMLEAKLRGLRLTINPMMRLWHMKHEQLPDPEFWQAQLVASSKKMQEKWGNGVWAAMVMEPDKPWRERRKEISDAVS